MSDHILRILAVKDDRVAGSPATETLSEGSVDVSHQLYWADDHRAALERLDNEEADIVLLELAAIDDAAVALVVTFRQRAPSVPIIAIAPDTGEGATSCLMRAGADDCLVQTDGLAAGLTRAIRHAVERSRYQARSAVSRDNAARDTEFGNLQALCGPLPMPVTERSFGGRSLPERAAERYSALVVIYLDLLDLTLERRRVGELDRYDDLVDEVVNKLGALNAGPRDLIEIHKAAIKAKLPGSSSRRARAYIEEGRLMLLHLMGQLVSYYRALSWGRLPTARPRSRIGTIKPTTTEGNV